jgi:hypothetical protein
MASGAPITFTVSHRGQVYPLSIPSDSTVAQLQSHLETLTSIPPSLQKLLYRGKPSNSNRETLTLADAGFKDGMKVQMLGSSMQDIEGMKAAEDQKNKRERILQERARKAPVKVSEQTIASTPFSHMGFCCSAKVDFVRQHIFRIQVSPYRASATSP